MDLFVRLSHWGLGLLVVGSFLTSEKDSLTAIHVKTDFHAIDGKVASQHYAFLVSEAEFDQVLGRIRGRDLTHWADPAQQRPGEINHNDGGRGVYFEDHDGHLLEIITRPYGSAAGHLPTRAP